MTAERRIPRRQMKKSRILELDALRGLAAVAVVLFHYTTRYDQLFGHRVPLSGSLPWGHYGVDLFFMLSGFVILLTLDRMPTAWQFIWARFSRLYPAYWAAVALTFAAVACCGLPGLEVSWTEALVNLTMIQALLGAPHVDGAYWSLQAELIFYANMLVFFRLGFFRYPVLTVAGWVAVALGVIEVQPLVAAHQPWLAECLSKLTTIASLKYIPLFGIGILFYRAHCEGRLSGKHLAAVTGCVLGIAVLDGLASAAMDSILLALLWLAVDGRLAVLRARPWIALGAISYPLYLVHENIGYLCIRYLQQAGVIPAIAIAVAITGSVLLATALHRWIELPAMDRLRAHALSSPWHWLQNKRGARPWKAVRENA